ncbi:MAG: glycosyl hydrolase 115 family protein [Lachnospiraceae bacterium]|nr:glycosyl hydrolase 115 family protein [Lachnospiraceae bacterium]
MPEYIISRNNIESGKIVFIYEETALSGVKKIADKVRKDVFHVFDAMPGAVELNADVRSAEQVTASGNTGYTESLSIPEGAVYPVIFGTAGHSPLLDELDSRGIIKHDDIRGKREVYSFTVADEPFGGVESALIIAGSDKRGTIYGLFHLSDILKVSPLTDWCDIMPDKMTELILTGDDDHISKEPSVRFRGFFINDEWPAFGNWTNKNFGGFNAEMYEHVFELLLRLKGNYLWPAMWSAIFPDDGPGLKNAELADELGVVMGMSHHEPCLRQGEEYKYLRGPGSIYGDAWDFRKNEAGITRFWEDGLKRGGHLENVITVGMRGEFDSTIMGEDATLKDNIDLLRDVLKTQNRLIRENVNEDLDKVPRMLALYKEVEPFFYGDGVTEGLMDSPELEGVTLMLCDDNFGNLRTLPTEHMREHNGGYGMYYHFDYHGWPVSYEWVNSTYLPKVWEQMTTAYEFGIRDLWIVNVGDIFTNEYPLSYFLSLAYDYEKWGIGNLNSVDEFNKEFIDTQFGNSMDAAAKKTMTELLKGYTRIANNRRPEAMNDDVYHAVNYGELEDLSLEITGLMETADNVSSLCDESNAFTFFQLIGYPLIATLNLTKLWLATTENHYLTEIGASMAAKLAKEARTGLALDRALTDKLHELRNGKWYGMGMSEHIGFRNWNEEECRFPVLYENEPSNKARLVVTVPGTEQYTEGSVWSGKKLILPDFLDPSCDSARVTLYTTGRDSADYEVKCDVPWLEVSSLNGTCPGGFCDVVYIKCIRENIPGNMSAGASDSTSGKASNNVSGTASDNVPAVIVIHSEYGDTQITVPVNSTDYSGLPANTYVWCGYNDETIEYKPYNYISMEAEHYASANSTDAGCFIKLKDYGRTLSAMKAFPVTECFEPGRNAPSLDYLIYVDREDEYEITVYSAPCNPVSMDNKLRYGISSAAGNLTGSCKWEEEIETVDTVPEDFKVSDHQEFWAKGVLDNIRISSARLILTAGINTVRLFAMDPGFVPEKIVISEAGIRIPGSYLGPKETFRTAFEADGD